MTELKGDMEVTQADNCLRLTPHCDVVASSVKRLRAAMLESLSGTATDVVLDLSNVHQMDSLGVSLVVGLFKSCTSKGQRFAVVSVSRDIARVFRLFSLHKYFSITEAYSGPGSNGPVVGSHSGLNAPATSGPLNPGML